MATTTNFGWETPDDTDLVKDGALAMRTLGNSIDSSFVDLKGGTTGQVLAKASNTDLDYTWVTQDDANAIQNAIVDAKGDLITATAADTPSRIAVGNNGETLVADSSASTGLRWQGNYSAGKNALINGDFRIWQRGTSFAAIGSGAYSSDRWQIVYDGTGARTISQQTFTPGSAPVAGYEGTFFFRYNQTTAGTGATYGGFQQRIEDVRTDAGQTVTLSLWAKADANRSITYAVNQNFGSGGSPEVAGGSGTFNLTTAWTRFTATFTLPSLSGKTIGTSSFLNVYFGLPINTTQTIDIWGVQLEVGSTATAFQTATGTLAGELAACQRYYWRQTAISGNYARFNAAGLNQNSTTNTTQMVSAPVNFRSSVSAIDYANIAVYDGNAVTAVTSLTVDNHTANTITLQANVASGLTAYRPYCLIANNNSSAYIGLSAEL